MENQAPKPEWLESLEKEGDSIADKHRLSAADRQGKLLRWTIRQVLTGGLVWYFWDKSWTKYIIWIWIPLAVLALAQILFFNALIDWKMAKVRNRLAEINQKLKEDQEDQAKS